ncbi:hypothetical protein PALB_13340 [Pseudoalteromonas luteoviolacea B = ATCC 29581]|nr:hypothetical protein PALB_13340 [Pseudoalteromonas luteoviolacea B = ATCC 29581]
MRSKFTLSMLALCFTGLLQANEAIPEKSWFNSIEHVRVDSSSSDNMTMVSSHYYFAPQGSSGVLDDFGYLDTDTNLQVAYADLPGSNVFSLGGEYFFENEVFLVGGVARSEGDNDHVFGVGYVFNGNVKTSITRNDNDTFVSAQYLYALNSTDYLGFSAHTDVDFDEYTLASRYLGKRNNGDYVSVDVSYSDSFGSSVTSILGKYYFAQRFALGLGAVDSEITVTGNYFISDEYYLRANYLDSVYSVGFVAQF